MLLVAATSDAVEVGELPVAEFFELDPIKWGDAPMAACIKILPFPVSNECLSQLPVLVSL